MTLRRCKSGYNSRVRKRRKKGRENEQLEGFFKKPEARSEICKTGVKSLSHARASSEIFFGFILGFWIHFRAILPGLGFKFLKNREILIWNNVLGIFLHHRGRQRKRRKKLGKLPIQLWRQVNKVPSHRSVSPHSAFH